MDLLQTLVGKWEGTSRTWLRPDAVADETPIRARIRRIGDTSFVLHEYDCTFAGEPREGVEIVGLNLEDVEGGPFLSAWVDSFHMSRDVMLSRGGGAAGGFAGLGTYSGDAKNPSSPSWGWRSHLDLHDPNHFSITAYNISPEGQETKATETIYTRRA